MKKILKLLFVTLLCFTFLTGCGNKETEKENEKEKKPTKVLTSKMVDINGVYVDESVEKDGKMLVYLFYTLKAGDTNTKATRYGLYLKINDTNEYTANEVKDYTPLYTEYFYSTFSKDVLVGETKKVVHTYMVPKGDLASGKKVTVTGSYDGLDAIFFSTDDIKHMANAEEMAKDLDPEVYEKKAEVINKHMDKMDDAYIKKVKNQLNGYEYSGTVGVGTSYCTARIEFIASNKFKFSNCGISNSGTYTVRRNYILLKFKTSSETKKMYFEFNNKNQLELGLGSYATTNVDFDGTKDYH